MSVPKWKLVGMWTRGRLVGDSCRGHVSMCLVQVSGG